MSKILSIVIPVYNKWNFTKSCLNDLSKLPNDHEIIIIDNGSSDETQKQLEDNKEIIYHRNNDNLGFGKACNIGYNISFGKNVMFLNNDIRVKNNYENWTKYLIEAAKDAIVGPTMGQLDNNLNFIQEANRYLSGNSYMSGWCITSSREIWNKLIIKNYLGPFNEEYFCYFEDTDLSFRVREMNIKMKVIDVPVVHFGKVTSKSLNTAKLYKEAREIFVKKWINNENK